MCLEIFPLHVNKKRALCIYKRGILCVHLSCCPSERISSFLPSHPTLSLPQNTAVRSHLPPSPLQTSFSKSLLKTFPISHSLCLTPASSVFHPPPISPSPIFCLLMCDSFIVLLFLEVSCSSVFVSYQALYISFLFNPIHFFPPFSFSLFVQKKHLKK